MCGMCTVISNVLGKCIDLNFIYISCITLMHQAGLYERARGHSTQMAKEVT